MTDIEPAALKVGDFFSYPGLFKVYQVQSKPKIDPAFEDTRVICHSCNNPHQPINRYVFTVSDGDRCDEMGIRLRADTVCTRHNGFPTPYKVYVSDVLQKNGFEAEYEEVLRLGRVRCLNGQWGFKFDGASETIWDSSFDRVVEIANEKYQRDSGRDR